MFSTLREFFCEAGNLSLIVLMLLCMGCSAGRHGGTTADFKGFVVPVDSRPGATRLQYEMDYDPTIRTFVSEKGNPDYIFVVGRNKVKLIYRTANEVATFSRSFSCVSKVSIESGLTPDITARLSALDKAAFSTLNH